MDSFFVIFSNEGIKYWDSISSYYLLANFPKSRLSVFYEWGYPNRFINGNIKHNYTDHAMGTNIGLIKEGGLEAKIYYLVLNILD